MGGEIIQAILANLAQLLPWRIIMSYRMGVRWTWGKNPVKLEPGFHWCWWLMHTVDTVFSVEEVIDLPTQSLVTKDGKTVCFSVNIGLVVRDPVMYYCAVQDFDASTRGLAMTHLAERVRTQDYEDLVRDLKKLEDSLKGTLTTRFKVWGTEVTRVGFTDFVQTRQQIRLFQDQPTKKV